jgi:hypothetical protein
MDLSFVSKIYCLEASRADLLIRNVIQNPDGSHFIMDIWEILLFWQRLRQNSSLQES